jgi:hypothetical protein
MSPFFLSRLEGRPDSPSIEPCNFMGKMMRRPIFVKLDF